jgi:triosephosphate isomerase (TIM)
MVSRRTLIVANWKMHMNVHQSSTLLANLHKHISGHRDLEVVLAPSMLSLQPLSQEIDRRRFRLAAQNAYFKDEGAFTGEVSISMLRDLVHYVIVGHSERRIYFGETNDDIRDKVAGCIRNDISPILCIGETHTERVDGQTKQVLHDQLVTALSNVTSEDLNKVVIAYEPVWAISTFGGETADPDKVEVIMEYVRSQVSELYGDLAGKRIRVLYGGSVDDHSATSYLRINACDGLLVGGASLNYRKFSSIVEKAYKLNRERGQ